MNKPLEIIVNPVSAEKSYQTIVFIGEFDKAGHADIKTQLDEIVQGFAGKSLVFDFTQLKFINSEGIGYLMEIHTHLTKKDKKLVLIGLNAHVDDVFTTIGIRDVIKVYGSLDEFLKQ